MHSILSVLFFSPGVNTSFKFKDLEEDRFKRNERGVGYKKEEGTPCGVLKNYAVCFLHPSRNTVREYISCKERPRGRERIHFIGDLFWDEIGYKELFKGERENCLYPSLSCRQEERCNRQNTRKMRVLSHGIPQHQEVFL